MLALALLPHALTPTMLAAMPDGSRHRECSLAELERLANACESAYVRVPMSAEPELEPELTPAYAIGVQEDAPRRPIPLDAFCAAITYMQRHDDPDIRHTGHRLDLIDWLDAERRYTAWRIRQ